MTERGGRRQIMLSACRDKDSQRNQNQCNNNHTQNASYDDNNNTDDNQHHQQQQQQNQCHLSMFEMVVESQQQHQMQEDMDNNHIIQEKQQLQQQITNTTTRIGKNTTATLTTKNRGRVRISFHEKKNILHSYFIRKWIQRISMMTMIIMYMFLVCMNNNNMNNNNNNNNRGWRIQERGVVNGFTITTTTSIITGKQQPSLTFLLPNRDPMISSSSSSSVIIMPPFPFTRTTLLSSATRSSGKNQDDSTNDVPASSRRSSKKGTKKQSKDTTTSTTTNKKKQNKITKKNKRSVDESNINNIVRKDNIDEEDDDDEEDEDDDEYSIMEALIPRVDESDVPLSYDELNSLSLSQLQQQIRLRGMKLSTTTTTTTTRNSNDHENDTRFELIRRLIQVTGGTPPPVPRRPVDDEKVLDLLTLPVAVDDELVTTTTTTKNTKRKKNVSSSTKTTRKTTTTKTMKKKTTNKTSTTTSTTSTSTKDFIDVTAYLDEEDIGQDMKTYRPAAGKEKGKDDNDNDDNDENPPTTEPEVWGTDALRVIHDYNTERLVVDNLSRTVIEFGTSSSSSSSSTTTNTDPKSDKKNKKDPTTSNSSNQDVVHRAYVVASREALQPYLAGGSVMNRQKRKTLQEEQEKQKQKDKQQQSPNDVVNDMEYDDIDNDDDNLSEEEKIQRQSTLEVQRIQLQREKEIASIKPIKLHHNGPSSEEPIMVVDSGDENRIITDVVLNRDYSDWGIYTMTGTQLSASEVSGIILLSDHTNEKKKNNDDFDDTTTIHALAEQIAFECQPMVVMVPDLIHNTDVLRTTKNEYIIRTAAMCLREQYGVSSVTVFGIGYGGGLALQIAGAAASNDPIATILIDGSTNELLPNVPPVQPRAVVAWYPTHYGSPSQLFGPNRTSLLKTTVPSRSSLNNMDDTISVQNQQKNKIINHETVAVMCIFAEHDTIPGATVSDAIELEQLLQKDERIKDQMIRIFPNQYHGFAHIRTKINQQQQSYDDLDDANNDMNQQRELQLLENEFGGSGTLSYHDSDAEMACLLSTAFLETYSRVFLPTIGPPIREEEKEKEMTTTTTSNSNGRSNTNKMYDDDDDEVNNEYELNKYGLSTTLTTTTNTPAGRSSNDPLVAVRPEPGRDVRREIEKALDEFVEVPLDASRIINPTSSNDNMNGDNGDDIDDESTVLLQLLKSMESEEQKNSRYRIQEDDDLPSVYQKLLSADPGFQIF